MELWLQPDTWIALATLTALEIVLGIDNIVFISILSSKLAPGQRERARQIGLGLAMFARIALLFSLTWLMGLTSPLFSVLGHALSGRDLILLVGGLFLLAKATLEIHEKIEGVEKDATEAGSAGGYASFPSVIMQILALDAVFSLDSVITAVGMADDIAVMATAVVIAVLFMLVFVNRVSDFVERRPTVKMLALSFLLLIGVSLVGEGLGFHLPKGYIYFAMAFSLFVELLNQQLHPPGVAPQLIRPRRLPRGEDV